MTTETLEALVSDVVGFVVDEVGNDFTTALDVEVVSDLLDEELPEFLGGIDALGCELLHATRDV